MSGREESEPDGPRYRVSVCLKRIFNDERSRCYVTVMPVRRVRWLVRRLRRLFELPPSPPLALLCRGHLLPPDEPLALLAPDDVVEVIPVHREENEIVQDCTTKLSDLDGSMNPDVLQEQNREECSPDITSQVLLSSSQHIHPTAPSTTPSILSQREGNETEKADLDGNLYHDSQQKRKRHCVCDDVSDLVCSSERRPRCSASAPLPPVQREEYVTVCNDTINTPELNTSANPGKKQKENSEECSHDSSETVLLPSLISPSLLAREPQQEALHEAKRRALQMLNGFDSDSLHLAGLTLRRKRRRRVRRRRAPRFPGPASPSSTMVDQRESSPPTVADQGESIPALAADERLRESTSAPTTVNWQHFESLPALTADRPHCESCPPVPVDVVVRNNAVSRAPRVVRSLSPAPNVH